MRTSVVVLASVLTAATAHAEKVGIVVTGEAALQPQLTSQLERWLHDRGRSIVPGALEPAAVGTLMDCFVLEDLGCARGVVEARAQARSVVYAKVEQSSNEDGTRDIKVTGYWFQKGHDTISEKRVCKQCTDDKLFDTVDELMLALVSEPPPPLEGAQKASTGASGATTSGAAGSMTAANGGATREGGSSRKMIRYGLVGAGGLALLGGITMIAIDEDPDPVGPQEPTYRDSATGGVIVGALGAAALGVGLYLWLTDKPSRNQPVAAVTRDGGFIGWTGRF